MFKILIVDDDELFAHMVAERLRRELASSHPLVEQTTTAEGAQALLQASTPPFDVVLVDHRLGHGMSGLALLAWLHEQNQEVDSVLFTGLDDPEIGMQAYEVGAFRYLVKPFDPRELVWIVQALIKKRAANYARNWLTVLSRVGAQWQQVNTLADVGQALVDGGVALGFERVQLYKVVFNVHKEICFQGCQQAGALLIRNFASIRVPYQESAHHRRVYDTKESKFFNGHTEGMGYLVSKLGIANSPPAVGEWVCIPLLKQNRCVATLVLDNPGQEKALRPEERELLHLFAQQASAVWERALVQAEQALDEAANEIVRQIIERTSTDGSPGNLDALLRMMYEAINEITPTRDFVVALKHNDPEINARGWFRYCLHIEGGAAPKAYWPPPSHQSLMRYVIEHEQRALYLSETTVAYRTQKALPLPGRRLVKSWIAIPLHVGAESIGGVFVNDYEQEHRWTQEQFSLCSRVVEQLAHYLQSTWINQQHTQLNEQLGVMQVNLEKIMELAQQQPEDLPEDEWLWHATLTLATAHYGFGFNRALLFLLEAGGAILKGRMGIGQLTDTEAKRVWEQDGKKGLTSFDRYCECLRQHQLTLTTSADQKVRNLVIPVQDAPAFAEVLRANGVVSVAARHVASRLPPAFIQCFSPTDYWLIPIKAGARLIGVIVLDNFCATQPPQTFGLKYLATLANETALIRENLRKARGQQQLLALNRAVLPNAGQLPLHFTLRKIARAAQLTTGADSVSIYPLKPNVEPFQLDLENFIWQENNKNNETPLHNAQPSPYMEYVLNGLQPLTVADTQQPHPSGIEFSTDLVVKLKGIRSFVCVPVRDLHSRKARGLLYLNYRWSHGFEQNAVEQAEAFANLIGMALKSWRDHQGLRSEKESREEELYSSLEILQAALQPDMDEPQLIATILGITKALFKTYDPKADLNLALFLQDWRRPPVSADDPIKIYHQYSLNKEGIFQATERTTIRGLSAYVLDTAQSVRVNNVNQAAWSQIYRQGHKDTQAEIDVPVIGENELTIGVLNIESAQLNYFTASHERMLQRLTRFIVLALDAIRRRKHLQALLLAGQAITVQRELRDTLRVVTAELLKILPDLSTMTVWYTNPTDDRLYLGSHAGIRNEEELRRDYPRPHGAVQAIMDRKEPLWAENVADYSFFVNSAFIKRENIHSTAAFPLVVAGVTIGVIFYAYREAHCFTKAEQELLPILTQYIAIGIHDAQLGEIAEKEKNRLQSALRVTEAVGATLDLAQIVKKTRAVLQDLYPDARSLFMLYNRGANALEFVHNSQEPYPINNPAYRNLQAIPLNEKSLMGKLALLSQRERREARMVYRNLQEREAAEPYLQLRLEARSAMGITYINTMGDLLGGLLLESDVIDAFNPDDLPLLEGIARQLALAVERAQQSAALDFRKIATDSMIWATDLVHDLNREIYHIRSWLQSLNEEKNRLGPLTQDAIQEIEASFNRIVRDAPWSSPGPSPIANLVASLMEWVNEFINPYTEQIEVHVIAPTPALALTTDASVLRRAIRHLMRNALKAMNYRGKIFLEIDDRLDGQVRIQITDTGPGIRNDDPLRRRLLQEPLTDRGRGGLGLLFAHLLIEKLGGYIHLNDFIKGQGASFCLYLPVKPPCTPKEPTYDQTPA